MSAVHRTRSPLPNRPAARAQPMARKARSAVGETLPSDCAILELPAQAALADLARLLGRRAAIRHRQSAGLASVGVGPVLVLVALAATAVLVCLSLVQGH
jgi:hypothetical protein